MLTIGIGLWIGIRAGWRRGSTFDKVSTPATMALYGTPEFFLGHVVPLVLRRHASAGFRRAAPRISAASYTGFEAIIDRARHLVLPVTTLTLGYLGSYSLVMRTSMLDTLREDYLVTARAKGLRDNDIMRRHAVPNALLPSVSLIAIGFGFIIGGAITTETVFSYPGLGLETYQSDRQQRPADDAGPVHVLQHRRDRLQHRCRHGADHPRSTNSSRRMSSPTWRRRRQSASRVWRQLRSDRSRVGRADPARVLHPDGVDGAAVRRPQ